MTEANLPYILELAGGAAASDDPTPTIELAVKNGIPRDQFERAIEVMKRVPNGPELVNQLYLADGWVRGYVGIEDRPGTWVLGQLAHGYYDLGGRDSTTGDD